MGSIIRVRNPRTGIYDYEFESTELADVSRIASEARAGQATWEALGLEGRLEVLNAWRVEADKNRDEILAALIEDTGRVAESEKELLRIPNSIDRLTILAREVFAERVTPLRSMPNVNMHGDFSPYPLVGVISPWNFPLSSSLLDTFPALVAGCAAIIKPSEVTPRFVEPLVRTIQKIPELAAILRYVGGDGSVGAELIRNVDAICFTGSTATGKKVAQAAAEAFIPAYLELGGKDPAIVTASADLDKATSAVLSGSVSNAGQVCVSLERIYVDEAIHDEFVEKLVDKASQVKIAYPGHEDGVLGPIIVASQADIINRHLTSAVEKGATIRCGGLVQELGGGMWARPTVVTDVDHSMALMTEETFGPVMPIMRFTSIEQAIELANDSSYGLSGAVFAGTTQEALEIARKMKVGAVSINSTGLGTVAIGEGGFHEKNAFAESGLGGSRLGYDSLTRFTRKKTYLAQG